MTIRTVPITAVHESPFNRRRVWDLDEITASIREHGVLQRPLARYVGAGDEPDYELVFGHRRFRGAKAAGLTEIDLDVRQMDDAAARALIAVENLQRVDVHPLDEAELYQAMHVTDGLSVEDIAGKLHKGKSYVYGRLKLCDLAPIVRDAFGADRMTVGGAMQFARYPAAAQEAAFDAMMARYHREDDPLSANDVAGHFRHHYSLRLTDAPFDRARADLTDVGACMGCPKRSGAQADLFGEGEADDDRCLDAACYMAKRQAAWAETTAEAAKKGQRVLTVEESTKLLGSSFSSYGAEQAGYVDLDATCYQDKGGGRKFKAIIGAKDVKTLPVVLAPRADGTIARLVPKADVAPLLKAAGVGAKGASASGGAAEAKLNRAIVSTAISRMVGIVEECDADDEGMWRTMLDGIARTAWSDTVSEAAKRRGVETKGVDVGKALLKHSAPMSVNELRGLVFELLLSRGAYASDMRLAESALKKALDFCTIDIKAIAKEVAREAEAKKNGKGKAAPEPAPAPTKANGKAPKKAAPAPAKDKPNTCRECGCTDDTACETDHGPCAWVEPDLCSGCAPTDVDDEHIFYAAKREGTLADIAKWAGMSPKLVEPVLQRLFGEGRATLEKKGSKTLYQTLGQWQSAKPVPAKKPAKKGAAK